MNMKQSILIFLILSLPICGNALTVTIDSIVPNPFSPNGDGMLDSAKIYCTVSDTHTLRLYAFFGDPFDAEWVVGPFSAGSYTYSWGGAGYPSGTYRTYIFARDTSGVDHLSADSYITIELQKPFISNVSASPNPFSPDGDGRNDVTHIKYTLSEPCSMVTIVFEGTPPDTHISYNLGSGVQDLTWYGAGYPDGTYRFTIDAMDPAGNSADQVDGEVTIDTKPANIYNVSVSPNPFTPNNDGIKDYCYIDFYCDSTHPAEWDSVFAPDSILGYIIVQDDTSGLYSLVHTFPPFPVYLYLVAEQKYDYNITVTLTYFSNIYVTTDILAESDTTDTYRVGTLTNKFENITVKKVEGGLPGDSIRVYCFTGNARVTIYNEDGSPQGTNWNFWEEFRGDGCYHAIWGPDGIADGNYIYRIVVEDEAASLIEESGIIEANSTPIYISDVSANPTTISPADTNGLYDVSKILYKISEPGIVTIKVYNSPTVFDSTTLVRTLLDGIEQTEGAHSVYFDGKDYSNDFLAQNSCSTYTYVITVIDLITPDEVVRAEGDITVDNLPPARPSFQSITTPTNQSTITVDGGAEKGVFVELFVNGSSIGVTTAHGVFGFFSFDVALTEGPNWIYGSAIDSVYNVSAPSDTKDVFLDATDPVVSLVFPSDGSFRNDSILGSVYAVISDGALGCGIDLNGSYIKVLDVPGNVVRQAPDTLVFVFTDTLKDTVGNIYDGTYTIQVIPVDSVGNDTTYTFSFLYDTKEPTSSPTPPDSAFVNELNSVSAVISDDGSGVDIDNSFIYLMDSDTNFVPGSVSDDGVSEVFYTPDPLLDTLGFEDGRYYIKVEARDNANNTDSMFTTLIYDTKAPRIAWSYPKEDTAVGSPIYKVKVVVTDSSDVFPGIAVSGKDFSKSSIKLLREDYSWVSTGIKTTSGDTLIWELNDPLDVDGKYYIYTKLYDNASNFSENYIGFYYDVQNPVITNVIPSDGANVRTQISEVKATLYDAGSGIDAGSSTIMLLSADSDTVPGNQSTKSDTIILTLLNPLTTYGTDDGRYYVAVKAYDMAGWSEDDTTTFIYDTRPPVVDSTIPKDAVWVNASSFNDTVYAAVRDTISGIAVSGIDTLASTIELLKGDEGDPGTPSNSGDSLLIWALSAGLATDGTDDGEYTIKVNLKDNAGNSSTITNKFNYDTQTPTISNFSISPPSGQTEVTENDNITISGMVSEYATVVAESLIQYKDIAATDDTVTSSVTGINIGVDGTISGTVNIGALTDSTKSIRLLLVVSDRAGNTTSIIYSDSLIADRTAPVISSFVPFDNAMVNTQITSISVTLTDDGTGVDADSSTIRLEGPSVRVAGSQSNVGNTFTWTLTVPLFTDGSDDGQYSIIVRAFDKAGNVAVDTSSFIYDTRPPWVVLTDPLNNATVTDTIDTVYAIVSDSVFGVSAWSGINFFLSETNLLRENDTKVPGSGTTNGDTLFWVLNTSLDVDGNYKLRTILWDNATNCDTLISSFVYDLSDPVVKSMLPQGNVNVLDTVVAVVADLGSGIDFDSTTIVLEGPFGIVSDSMWNDGDSTIYFSPDPKLDKNGAHDGKYWVYVTVSDGVGHTVSDTSSLIYDTWLPSIDTTYPYQNELVGTPLNSVYAVLSDTNPVTDSVSGVDFIFSMVELYGPDGNRVPGSKSVSGDTIKWTMSSPPEVDGDYQIKVKKYDRAKNADTTYVPFSYDIHNPYIVWPLGFSNTFVSIRLRDVTGGGGISAADIEVINPYDEYLTMWDEPLTFQGDTATIKSYFLVPLKTNGADDGRYTVLIYGWDHAGHTLVPQPDTCYVSYDNIAPFIISSDPDSGAVGYHIGDSVGCYISDKFAGVQFTSGIWFDSCDICLKYSNGTGVPGWDTYIDNGDGTGYLWWHIDSETNLPEDNYTMEVAVIDHSRNRKLYVIPFEGTSAVPEVIATVPPDGGATDSLTSIEVLIKDYTGTGTDTIATSVRLVGPDGPVPSSFSELKSGTVDTLVYSVDTTLATDGSDDGSFTITAIPYAVNGKYGEIYQSTFIYDTQEPVVKSITPQNGSFVNSLTLVSSVIYDQFSGIDFTASTVSLRGPIGTVPGDLANDGDSVISFTPSPPLETNGGDDGKYTITVTAYDMATHSSTDSATIIYDTWLPWVSEAYPAQDDIVGTPLSFVYAVITDSNPNTPDISGIDTLKSWIKLYNWNNEVKPGSMVISGDTIRWEFPPLTNDGAYTTKIKIFDLAGNSNTIDVPFYYDLTAPYVDYTTPANHSNITTEVSEVTAIIRDPGGAGINFDSTVTYIELIKSPSHFILGLLSDDGDSTLTFTLLKPLLDNGADDGFYKILVYGEDNTGRPLLPTNPDTNYFIYDNIESSITESEPDSGEMIDTLVWVDVSDIFPGVDSISGIDFNASTISLIGPSGKGVPGYQVNLPGAGDRTGTLQYKINSGAEILTGWYQTVVHLLDKAGNITDSTISFYGISRIPDVVSTVPEEGDFVNYLDEVKALIDRKGLAIDTSLSVIQISGADTVISETKSLLGDTLKLNFDSLPQDGSMDDEWVITVTPVAGGKTGATEDVHFVYDTRPPYITAFVPPPNDTIGHNWPQIIVTVEDSSLSGVDFDASTVNLFGTLWNPVAGTQSTDYVNKIYFTLSSPLSDTGWYHIVADIYDRAGNTRIDTSDFYFTTAILPEIVRTIPLEDTVQYQLTEVACLLISNSGQPINKLTSTIYLVDTSSDTIPGSRVWSGDTIRWVLSTPLADDGSDNGLYTVLVHAVDEKPCITDGSFGFLYLYDAVPPGMPYLVTLVPDTTSEGIIDTLKGCAEPLSQVKLLNVFNDSIIHSDSVIAAGDSSFTFLDIPLLTGINTLKLTATDVFSNASDTLIKIIYQFPQPLIISTFPAEDTTITEQLTRIYAIVEDTISGIDEDSSTIVLLNSVNDTIPGSKSWSTFVDTVSGDTMPMIIYTLTQSLANDGTADGNYNVSMKIVNQAKVPRYRDYSFTYICDEVPPFLWVGGIPSSTIHDSVEVTVVTDSSSFVRLSNLNVPTYSDTTTAVKDTLIFENVPLVMGTNIIVATSADASQNVSSDTVSITRAYPTFAIQIPMPFNDDSPNFIVYLPKPGEVSIKLFNLAGEFVAKLPRGTPHTGIAGRNIIPWIDFKNESDKEVNNGLYIYIIEVKYEGGTTEKKKALCAVIR